ncbi:MAG TPA: hypothetical protein VFQ23_14010 [Anaerolineales bacterium]|nr:hypothetical protein [Anaerolineales bacterium]
MKRLIFFLSLILIVNLACDVSVNLAPSNEVATAAETPVLRDPSTPTPEVFISLTQAVPATAIIQPSLSANTLVTIGRLTLEIPSSVADGASGSDIPRADEQDLPTWGKTPGHTEIKLEGYTLQGKFHEPRIYVYPSLDYATLVPAAFESMHRLRNIMNPGAPITSDRLPNVPFFNATQVFASNLQSITFQNGSGFRFLAEYAQYFAPVNNNELVYHFQGFSADGEYYIIAILPITAPALAETSDVEAVVPAGGIAFPDIANPVVDVQTYYASITDLLNATDPEAFTPPISQLDALIQSMWVAP